MRFVGSNTVGWVALTCLACAGSLTPRVPPGELADTGRSPDPRGRVFLRTGCDGCHGVAALGVTARDSTAPDLSLAAARVPSLYGVSLARFLEEPTGAMAVVLGMEIRLQPVDRDSIVVILESLARDRRD